MTEIRKILLASDLTERSQLALVRAVQLKRATAAGLTLLHIVEPGLSVEVAHARRTAATAKMETLLSHASHGNLRRVAIQTLAGDPAAAILALADASGVDLIVVGEPGRHRLKEFFIGTTVERIIRNGQQPVVVAKVRSDKPYRRVLVAFDLSEAARRVLDIALSLAPRAEFRLVHAWQGHGALGSQSRERETNGALDLLHDAARRARRLSQYPHTKLAVEIVEGPPASTIADGLSGFGADLLAIGTHGRAKLRTTIFGSVAQELIAASSSDVLVARP